MNDHSKPTWKNQLWQARRVLKDGGPNKLINPHALTGSTCGCGECFCCAALQVAGEMAPVELHSALDRIERNLSK